MEPLSSQDGIYWQVVDVRYRLLCLCLCLLLLKYANAHITQIASKIGNMALLFRTVSYGNKMPLQMHWQHFISYLR